MLRFRKPSKRNIPKEARKSLEILDNVISKYDEGENVFSRSESFIYVKTRTKSRSHEDVRRSLEILDNVLAEYDDGNASADVENEIGENWQEKQTQVNNERKNATLNRESKTFDSQHFEQIFEKTTKDGATSQLQVFNHEDKAFSPPPVPKRNPATRLSSRENLTLCESSENIYANSFEIRRNIFDMKDGYRDIITNQNSKPKRKIKSDGEMTISSKLSNQFLNSDSITKKTPKENDDLTPTEDNDDVFVSRTKLTLFRSASASMMTVDSVQKSPTVASRRALYEKINITAEDNSNRPVIHSDSSDLSVRNSPIVKKKNFHSPKFHKRNASDVTQYKILKSNQPLKNEIHRSQTFKTTTTTSSFLKDSISNRLRRETNEERLTRLDKKFAEVRYLLKTKQIKPLICGPPGFTPTPPPQKIARTQEKNYKDNITKNVELQSDNAQTSSCFQSDRVLKPPVSLVNTISDISCMLPTDTLNRPHLGLSYCMEDDLSPGVKELLTSTPKSDKSMLGLSTFSQSFSSLGYGSGQSDSDLNLSLTEENKQIPITNLKSQTLPIGMKLGTPFSYGGEIECDCDNEIPAKENIINTQPKCESDTNHFRSSSAPPSKHLLQRKNKFGMSRKDPKERDKNKDDNSSLKSNLSADDGIVLRKITTLDGSTETSDLDLSGRKQTSVCSEEKTKRKSVWKSILRRK